MKIGRIIVVGLGVGLLPLGAIAAPDDPTWVEARRVPFGKVLTLKGVLGPGREEAVRPEPKAWKGTYEIQAWHDLGPVTEGAILARFDRAPYERAVEKAEVAHRLAWIQVMQKRRAAERLGKELDHQRKDAAETLRRAEDDLAWWKDVERPMRLAEAAHRLEGTRDNIADQKEELAQLEKMYGEDDLTEETEEIVMSRARRRLRRSLRNLEFQLTRNKRWKAETLAREDRDRAAKVRKAAMARETLEAEADGRLEKATLEARQAQRAYERQGEALAELRADASTFEIRAPFSGTLRDGAWMGAHWAGNAWRGGAWRHMDAAEDLAPGEDLPRDKTVRTLVSAGPLHVAAQVEEKERFRLEAGLVAGVSPVADPSVVVPGDVVAVAAAPERGRYVVTLRLLATHPRLQPGMACTIDIADAHGEEALVVPASAIASEGDQSVVTVHGADGATSVAIVPGEARAGRVSIAKGLDAGARVRLQAPTSDDR